MTVLLGGALVYLHTKFMSHHYCRNDRSEGSGCKLLDGSPLPVFIQVGGYCHSTPLPSW